MLVMELKKGCRSSVEFEERIEVKEWRLVF
jgi:hypothetical protein